MIVSRRGRGTMRERMTKSEALQQWIECYNFKYKSEQLNLKASRHRALSQQIFLKMILERMRKGLRKEKKEV